jgi:hypothetical protein
MYCMVKAGQPCLVRARVGGARTAACVGAFMRLENQRLVGEGKTELHARADDGTAIMDLMCRHFSI